MAKTNEEYELGVYIWKVGALVTWKNVAPTGGDCSYEEFTVTADDFDAMVKKVKAIALHPSKKFEDENDDGNPTGKFHSPTSVEIIEVERGDWIDG